MTGSWPRPPPVWPWYWPWDPPPAAGGRNYGTILPAPGSMSRSRIGRVVPQGTEKAIRAGAPQSREDSTSNIPRYQGRRDQDPPRRTAQPGGQKQRRRPVRLGRQAKVAVPYVKGFPLSRAEADWRPRLNPEREERPLLPAARAPSSTCLRLAALRSRPAAQSRWTCRPRNRSAPSWASRCEARATLQATGSRCRRSPGRRRPASRPGRVPDQSRRGHNRAAGQQGHHLHRGRPGDAYDHPTAHHDPDATTSPSASPTP